MTARMRVIAGDHLTAARRAVAVALVVDVAAEEVHAVRTMLPPQSDMVRVLDVLGWPGSPEAHADLSPDDQDTLATIVYATLILALEETERTAYQALRETGGGLDTSPMLALESLARLALWLNDAGPISGEDVVATSREVAAEDCTPLFSALAASVALPVWVTDADFAVEWVNPALREILGDAEDDLHGKTWRNYCDPADIERVEKVMAAAALEQRNFTVEVGAGPPGGPYARLLMVCAPRLEPTGTLVGWTGICFDVSEGGAARDHVKELVRPMTVTSARTAALLEAFPGDIWTVDRDFMVISGMGASIRGDHKPRIGVSVLEIVGATAPDHPIRIAYEQALAGAPSQYYLEFEGRSLDVRVRPLRDSAGDIIGCIGVSLDVSDLVEAGERNAELLEHLELAQEIGNMGSWDIDPTTRSGRWSDHAYRILGVEPGAVPATFESLLSFVHPDDADSMVAEFADGERSGTARALTFRIIRPDGVERMVYAVAHSDLDGQGITIRTYGVFQDVTDMLVLEQTASRQTRQLGFSQDVSKIGSWELDPATDELVWTDEIFRILGLEPGVALPSQELLLGRVHPDDLDRVVGLLETNLPASRPYEVTFRIVRFDAEIRDVSAAVRFDLDGNGNQLRVYGTFQDVSDLLRARDRSERLADQLAFAQEIAQIGTWEFHVPTGTGLWSETAYRIFGLDPASGDPMQGTFMSLVHPTDADRVRALSEAGFRDGGSYDTTFRIVRPDFTVRDIRAATTVTMDANGVPHRIFGIFQDVTALVEAARRAARSESQLAVADAVGRVASWDLDVTTGALIWSPEVYRLLGLEPGAVEPTFGLFASLVHPDDLDAWLERHTVGTASRQPYTSEFRIDRPDGTVRILRASIGLETDDAGSITRQFGILQDITHAVETTNRAERLARQLQMVQRLTDSGSWELDLASGISLWSDGTYDILGIPRGDPTPSVDEFVDREVHPDDRAALHAVVDAHVRSGSAFSTSFRVRQPGGSWSNIDLYAEFDHDVTGRPVTMRGTLQSTPPRTTPAPPPG